MRIPAHRIELRHIRYFIAVAEAGSLRRAAEVLNISQPPLGRQITHLEHQLGVKLFERSRKGFAVTEAGAELLELSRDLMDRLNDSLETIGGLSEGTAGSLSIEFTDDFFYSPLIQKVLDFGDANPSMNVGLRLAQGAAALRNIANGTTDVAFLAAPLPDHASNLEMSAFLSEPLLVALPQGHAFADRDKIKLSDLADESFICSDLNSTFYVQIAPLLRSAGVEPKLHTGVWPTQFALQLVAKGIGINLLCRDAAPVEAPGVKLVPLADQGAMIRRCAVWKNGRKRRSVERFLDHFLSEVADILEPRARAGS